MPFFGVRALALAVDSGEGHTSWIYKSSGPGSFGQRWADMSMGGGTPRYNAYSGNALEATALVNTGNAGVYLGPTPPSGKRRYLSSWMLLTTGTTILPTFYQLQDYLLFYPLIDGDSTDSQDMANVVPLPRYQSGEGVRGMMIVTAPMTVDGLCTVTYTNSDGVPGRTTTFGVLANASIGVSLATGNSSLSGRSETPLFPLADGDRGIRLVESVQFATSIGGLCVLVLVKPLSSTMLYETGRATERINVLDKAAMPRIYDGAYLNFIFMTAQGGNGVPLVGYLDFAWG